MAAPAIFTPIARVIERLRHSRPVGLLRYWLYLTILALPRRRTCNLCGWSGSRFLTYVHRHVLCPRCGAQVRHRLIAAALERAPERTGGARIEGACVLHFAPEYCLESRFRPRAALYVAATYGLDEEATDLRASITHLPIADASFDLVICCDVLEHVEQDRVAMGECFRALRPGGVAIITVPTFDEGEPTFEDSGIVDPEARVRAFGQRDHVRNYGLDIVSRLEGVGFVVSVVDATAFGAEEVRRFVLEPPEGLGSALGWDRRRIFFARRPCRNLPPVPVPLTTDRARRLGSPGAVSLLSLIDRDQRALGTTVAPHHPYVVSRGGENADAEIAAMGALWDRQSIHVPVVCSHGRGPPEAIDS